MFNQRKKIRALEEENQQLKQQVIQLKKALEEKIKIDSIYENKKDSILNNLESNNRPFRSLRDLEDVEPLLSFIPDEEPEIIAAISARLQPSHVSKIMNALSPEKRDKVRLALRNMQQIENELDVKKEKFINQKIEKFISKTPTTTLSDIIEQ